MTGSPDQVDGDPDGEALLARVAPLDLRADLQPPSVVAGIDGARSLFDPTPLVTHLEAGLFTPVPGYPPADLVTDDPHRRTLVAASIGCQSVVGRVATTVLLGVVVDRTVLAVTLDDLRWWPARFSAALGLVSAATTAAPCSGGHPRPRVEGEGSGVVDDLCRAIDRLTPAVVAPWVATLRAATDAPDRLLWGAAGAGLATAATAACRIGALPVDGHRTLLHHIAGALPLPDLVAPSTELTGGWRRTTCCLIVDAGLAPCDECPRPNA